jgi:SAM-dependent methyltransferase
MACLKAFVPTSSLDGSEEPTSTSHPLSPRSINLDAAGVMAQLSNIDFPFEKTPSLMHYHSLHANRYAITLSNIEAIPGRNSMKALELAANPYGMTPFLADGMFASLTASSFSDPADARVVSFRMQDKAFDITENRFNVEKEVWPFGGGAFDIVIACEIVEHLAMDPMALFCGASHVLAPNGLLFVSTPNASSLQNFIKLSKFLPASLAPHFRSPANLASLYERHNREYSPITLAELFRSAGFVVEVMRTDDAYPLDRMGMSDESIQVLQDLIGSRELRRDTITLIGRKTSGIVDRYPSQHDLYLTVDG